MSAHEVHTRHDEEYDNPATVHEESDVNVRGVVGFAIALTIVAITLHVAVWLLFRVYAGRTIPEQAPAAYPVEASGRPEAMPPMPRLQTNPRQDLRDLRAQEDRILTTYGWADQNGGSVRIPIDQAMKLAIQRGLPARNAPAPGAATSTGDANSGRVVGDLNGAKPANQDAAKPGSQDIRK